MENNKKFFSIAIDGPAGAGKSTIAKAVAAELGFTYIDTGAMYRVLGYYFMTKYYDMTSEEIVREHLDEAQIAIRYLDGSQHVYLNGEDVSDRIRTGEVGEAASTVSAYGFVRKKMVSIQQDLATKDNVIMDGRDIGSVVLPDADLKIYLNASVSVRAERRYKEFLEKGISCELSQICKEISERDYRDMNRKESPLVCVEDAVIVDTSDMTIDEVKNKIITLFNNKRG